MKIPIWRFFQNNRLERNENVLFSRFLFWEPTSVYRKETTAQFEMQSKNVGIAISLHCPTRFQFDSIPFGISEMNID